ncbi:thromboxane-A synthase [Clupea harengus]|uniref:Thromboxane-A synthase n=1 Tax=Clupea harengus TaxID=7950 RepID=A0A6P8FB20_CLUHA|nr:thromboxane-A synthase [Clupea harengus]XP_031420382.1 thromboxane-A synthase [Clupea harengus]
MMDLVMDALKALVPPEPTGMSVSIGLFMLFLGLLYWYSIYPYSVLERCGVPHPRPTPFFGNLMLFRQGFLEPLKDLINTYGRVCGYYLGRRPVIVIADPDMLRQVMVKDFSLFPNRMRVRFSSKPMSDCLLMLTDEQWKRVRSILTPSFSAAKMKEMVPLINTATQTLLTSLEGYAESGQSFDIHKSLGCFTMDVIASVAFGLQLDSQNDPDDPFVHHAQKFFSFSFFRPIVFVFIMFPFLVPLLRLLPSKNRDEMNIFFISCIKKMIQQRDELPPDQRRRDFLQLMLDARSTKESVSLEQFDIVNQADEVCPASHTHSAGHAVNGAAQEDGEESPRRPHTHTPTQSQAQKRVMTEDEIVGQAFIFLLAGYETSSNTLAFTCYLLATHPDCQERLQREVDDFFSRHDSPDYNNVQELKYMDLVVSETLRMYPPGFRYARTVEEDCVVNGQFLPKGATLEIPAGFLHYDPEHWPEPEKFIPERFTAEAKASRHPFVYLPFGAGPRSCVGMRLAQLEMKMALALILQRFTVEACSETKVPLELKSNSTLGPKNGILVKITIRESSHSSQD